MNCLIMEIDKKIVVKLVQVLEDLKKSLKGVNIETNDTAIEDEIDLLTWLLFFYQFPLFSNSCIAFMAKI